MSVSYDVFTGAFLSKVTAFDFCRMSDLERTDIVDGYMKRAISNFKYVCKYDLVTTANDAQRIFEIEIDDGDIDEIVDIISEGMVVQWLKQYVYHQELLENMLKSTRDFATYSPAELLMRVGSTHKETDANFRQMIREYSFNHADLSSLHF